MGEGLSEISVCESGEESGAVLADGSTCPSGEPEDDVAYECGSWAWVMAPSRMTD